MRLLIAMMKHETNTFSPVPTDWRRFEDWGLHQGEGVPAALAGTNTPTAAYLDLARAAGAVIKGRGCVAAGARRGAWGRST